jgi:hypothetical protein
MYTENNCQAQTLQLIYYKLERKRKKSFTTSVTGFPSQRMNQPGGESSMLFFFWYISVLTA